MWRSVFLHEFLDTDIRNYQALAGSPTPASLTLTPTSNRSLRTNTVQITPGRGFEYSLAEPLDEVIGISGRLRLRYPIQTGINPVPIMRVGDMAEFTIRPFLDPLFNPAEVAAPARGFLRIGQTEIALGVIVFAHRRFIDVRFDWHSSGQARLLQDGRLVGYQNAVASTAQLEVNKVVFGLPNAPIGARNPRYEIGRVFVRVLRRSDSPAAFSKLFPEVKVPGDSISETCYVRTTFSMLAIVDRLRQFMALANQKISQPWASASGPPEGPFTPEAIAAHELATKALVELVRMLRSGDFSTADGFLEPFEKFLRILHDALPDEFSALATEFSEPFELPDECEPVLEAVLSQHRETFMPLVDVLSEASNRLKDIAGGS
jgi:hypothetical protein